MKDLTQIIIKPLITEKASLEKAFNKYFFVVKKEATKGQIKQAVEKIFNVRVMKVNTSIACGKPVKRWGKTIGEKGDWKKAIVTLYPGEKIEMIEGLY